MKQKINKLDREVIKNVERGGWMVLHIFEGDGKPRFTYTIGLFRNFGHPEIIIIGLKPDLAHILLNNMGFEIKTGKKYSSGNFYEDILDNYLCYFGSVPPSKYEDYIGSALRFYKGEEIPLLQCVYPTVQGLFPWEKGVSEEAKFFMKLLTEKPKTGTA